jgi:diguanylate cyclase (GGDEF)-like protein
MNNIKFGKSILDIISTIALPVFSGAASIFWVINFLKNPFRVFPLISVFVLALYYVSGSIYSGVFTAFAVIIGLLSVVFIDGTVEKIFVICGSVWLALFYFVLKMYGNSYLSLRNAVNEECETLIRKISIEESETAENKKRVSDIKQKIRNFQKVSRMIETFQSSLDEDEIIEKSGELAFQFIGMGEWKLKKRVQKDVFAKYVKDTGLPLIITDLSSDIRFTLTQNRYLSVIAVPIEVNGSLWGVLRGTSEKTNAFNDADLRLLSILAGIVNTVLNNAYLYRRLGILAITDGLTGLYTHNYFKERLREEIRRARANNYPLTVAVLDIDFFKNVNDTYGHQAGDSILSQIGLILRDKFRKSDLLSRYGGEEFGIILLHSDIRQSANVLEEIRKTIERERFFIQTGNSCKRVGLTVSIGFAELDRKEFSVEDDLIKKADEALYKAKNSGRNKTVGFIQ